MAEFFVDRSLGRVEVADALRSAGAVAHVHDDHFDVATPDEVWIAEVGRKGWLVLTKDKNLRRRPIEIEAIRAAGAKVFALGSGNRRGSEMAAIFVRHLDAMRRMAADSPGSLIVSVTANELRRVHPD
jgi:hypothetical protein